MNNLYEVMVSFTYNADDPVDAAKQFVAALRNTEWYLSVRNVNTDENFTVDTETWELE